MKNKILFRTEFKNWLIESCYISQNSADSYASYIAGVNEQFEIEGVSMCELIEKHHHEGNSFKINQIIIDVINVLYSDDICIVTGRPQKTINNWRSALVQYTEFFYYFTVDSVALNSVVNNEDDADITTISIENNTSQNKLILESQKKNRIRTFKYPALDLMRNFKFRMITQDRFSGELFFPISYIKRLFHTRNEVDYFNKWLEDQINDILIYCENETCRFKDISGLTIKVSKELKEVFITVNKEQKLIFSPTSNGAILTPFASPNLKSIAIDHVNSMKTILKDNVHHLPQLSLITKQLKQIVGEKSTANNYKNASSELLSSSYANEVEISLLKIELELIKSLTKLQLMDKIENIKKGAN